MKEKYAMLRGAIYARYKTKRAFAEALDWNPQRLYNVLKGRIEMKRSDMQQMKALLQIPDDKVSDIFLLNE